MTKYPALLIALLGGILGSGEDKQDGQKDFNFQTTHELVRTLLKAFPDKGPQFAKILYPPYDPEGDGMTLAGILILPFCSFCSARNAPTAASWR